MFSCPQKTVHNKWRILCGDGYTRIKRKFYLPPRQHFTLCPCTKVLTRWTYDTFYAHCRTYVLIGTDGTVSPPPLLLAQAQAQSQSQTQFHASSLPFQPFQPIVSVPYSSGLGGCSSRVSPVPAGSAYENMELIGGKYGDKLNRISRLKIQTGPNNFLEGRGSIVVTVLSSPSPPTKYKIRRRRDAKSDTLSPTIYLIPAHAETSRNPS